MQEYYNKHYIRLDEKNYIEKGFSDAFEDPIVTDICINEQGGRHFELDGVINLSLINMDGRHLFKYVDGKVIKTTEDERVTELATFPKVVEADPMAEYMIDLDYRLSKIEMGV